MAKEKAPGRPPGAANKGSNPRPFNKTYRVSEGFAKALDALVEEGKYKTAADALHEALQLLAVKKLQTKKSLHWIDKI